MIRELGKKVEPGCWSG